MEISSKEWGIAKEAHASFLPSFLPSFSSFTVSADSREKDVASQGAAQEFSALLLELVGGQVQVGGKLNMSQQCVLAAVKADRAPARE